MRALAFMDDLSRQRRYVRQHLESLRRAGVSHLFRSAARGIDEPSKTADAESVTGSSEVAWSGESGAPPGHRFAMPRPPAAPVSTDRRGAALAALASEVAQCARCSVLAGCRTQTVFGVGSPSARLCFVGEAPGYDEDRQGEPFVGRAGQLLDRIIAACKMRREEVYIANVLKCRPPDNRTPQPNEVANCIGYLERQLDLIRPDFICCLGSVAAQALLNTTQGIGKLRGRFHAYRRAGRDARSRVAEPEAVCDEAGGAGDSPADGWSAQVLCTYHPAYLLRNAAAKRDVWDDMKKLMAAMGRPVE